MLRKQVGMILYDDVTAMDVTGPLEVFSTATALGTGSEYACLTLACLQKNIKTEAGLNIEADKLLSEQDALDYLIIPGGRGRTDIRLQHKLPAQINRLHSNGSKVISICTGAFLLAHSGLLDGRKATTHWAYESEFRRSFAKVDLHADELFVDSGNIATSAGITAGIDLALKIVEDDYGRELAAKVARYMVVHYRRSGDQAQYSEPLKYQSLGDGPLFSLTAWIMENLSSEITLDDMSQRAGMSARSLYRHFEKTAGTTPARYLESIRLDYARQLLVDRQWSIKRVADACGYSSVDVFRRAFERRFGVSVKQYINAFKGK